MENQKQQNEVRELLIEWACQFTDKCINEDILPIASELINDTAFITLLKLWKKEKNSYERFRNGDVRRSIESKLDFPKLNEDLKLASYHNEVFKYNDALLTIVMHWGDAK